MPILREHGKVELGGGTAHALGLGLLLHELEVFDVLGAHALLHGLSLHPLLHHVVLGAVAGGHTGHGGQSHDRDGEDFHFSSTVEERESLDGDGYSELRLNEIKP